MAAAGSEADAVALLSAVVRGGGCIRRLRASGAASCRRLCRRCRNLKASILGN